VEHPLQARNAERVSRFCCYQIDPTLDPRWTELLRRHPKASVFHSAGWLRALKSTYGYEPVVFTTSAPTEQLTNGIAFCRVDSWLTKRRLVSLPFSDHCDPLSNAKEELDWLIDYLQGSFETSKFEISRTAPHGRQFRPVARLRVPASREVLSTHTSLSPDLQDILRGFDADCVRRRIRRADSAGLEERCGRSEELLKDFYGLFMLTRGRHQLPPIPYEWFQNLVLCQGEALEIRVAYKDGNSDFRHSDFAVLNRTVYYKYGCSRSDTETLFLEGLEIRRRLAASEPSAYRIDVIGSLNDLASFYLK